MQRLVAVARPHDARVQASQDQRVPQVVDEERQDLRVVQAREEHGIERRQVGHVAGRAAVPMIGPDLPLAAHEGFLHRSHLAGVQDVTHDREPVDVELGQRLFAIGHDDAS
ncbi:MAG: hypothetical protein OXJ90_15495 [Spirochaetaceae bacterium]|nr:hypothetical protein [Spirochaetaceae bacterium]